MKLKLLAVSMALAFAGNANAALTGLTDLTTGSSLFLTVWSDDGTNQKTYERDLGLKLTDIANGVTLASGLKSTFLDPNFTFDNAGTSTFGTFFTGVSPTIINWSVTVGRSSSGGQVLTTLSTPNLPGTYSAAQWNSLTGKADAWVGQLNALGSGLENTNTGGTLNNANVQSSWGTALGNTLGTGRFQNGVGFASSYSDLNAVGFYVLGQRANTVANAAIVDSVNSAQGKWWLSSDGGIHYAYSVAAVPEPSTYALLGAGLIVLGAVARRKS